MEVRALPHVVTRVSGGSAKPTPFVVNSVGGSGYILSQSNLIILWFPLLGLASIAKLRNHATHMCTRTWFHSWGRDMVLFFTIRVAIIGSLLSFHDLGRK